MLINRELENKNIDIKRKGGIAPSVFVGQIYVNKKGSKAEVVYYQNSKKVWICFLDDAGYVKSVGAGDLKKGNFKNPFHPSVYGIGCTGILSEDVKNHPLYKKAYSCWSSAVERCYSETWHRKFPTYEKCTVCDDWLIFTNFFKWFINQIGSEIEGIQLDKDLLIRGNKIYSPETCCLVPCILNNIVLNNESSKGRYKRGVTFDKRRGVFQASLSLKNKQKTLGVYKDEDSAHEAYLVAKKSIIVELANDWKGRVDDKVYFALLGWDVDV